MSKLLLIGLSWEQLPLLEQALKEGHDVVATGTDSKFLRKSPKYHVVNSRDLPALEDIFHTEKPEALIADECDYSMYAVSYFAEKYEKPGPLLSTLSITTNKHLQRTYAQNSGILQPKFELCWNLSTAREAARSIGFPVIVKPVDNRGSIGVGKASTEKELEKAWYCALSNSHSRMCLVEQFISGDVVTVEGFHDSEQLQLFTVATKEHYPETPNVAKVLFYPGITCNGFPMDVILSNTIQLSAAIGISFGLIHAEFLVERQTNQVWFLEIANRGGGVHISNRIIPLLTGINIPEKLIEMALGKRVTLGWNKHVRKNSVMYFVNPSGFIQPSEIIDEHQSRILALYMQQAGGHSDVQTQGAAGRKGVVLLEGDDYEEMYKLAQTIEKKIISPNCEFYWGRPS